MLWDFKKDRPIYTQLIEQIELRIISGVYQSGQKMPSVRDLAAEAAVNPNTMQRALTELEREGLLYTQRTSGRFITEDTEMIEKAKSSLATAQMNLFFDSMQAIGYNTLQTLALVEHANKEES